MERPVLPHPSCTYLTSMIIVRVYGVVQNSNGDYLLSTETYQGKQFTKFIGGGLEHGEGTRECLEREIFEETGRKGKALDHLYTTDFYLQSAFNPNDQIISVYYRASIENADTLSSTPMLQDYPQQRLQWIPSKALSPDLVTFPADKYLVDWLCSQ